MERRYVMHLIVSLLLMGAWPGYAEEGVIEEIVVTGSYIKRDNFDFLSPTQVIDQDDIVAEATPALGEIMANQTFNFGSDVFANGYARRCGLGAGATLNLVDGKRISQGNLNNMIPQIAIKQIDILKDGASALAILGYISRRCRLFGSDETCEGYVEIVSTASSLIRINVDRLVLLFTR